MKIDDSSRAQKLLNTLIDEVQHINRDDQVVTQGAGNTIPYQWRQHFFNDAFSLRNMADELRAVVPGASTAAKDLSDAALSVAFFGGSATAGHRVPYDWSTVLDQSINAMNKAIDVLTAQVGPASQTEPAAQ